MLPWKSRLFDDRERLGRWGEKRCESYLKRKGFKTLTRNFNCKTGEIDLVMVDTDASIVFVEVRTRTNETFSTTESSITTPKKTRLKRAARYFLTINNIENRPFRFDVVTIVLSRSGKEEIRHYKNAIEG
jgi:putative endonuclease